ncbi:MAG: DUF11 domain-containing protein [Dehalococcoidales bacterium]|nr:DUF11 domain-containing protein [Dehalococcoidales bacterium]
MKKRVHIFKRSIPIWLLVLALIACAAGAAVGTILGKKVIGDVPVTVSQALLVGEPSFPNMPSGVSRQTFRITPQPPDRYIGIVGDDAASFRAGAEVDTGDVYLIKLPLKNASQQDMAAELTLTLPQSIEAEVFGSDEESSSSVDHTFNMTRVGNSKWDFRVSHLADMVTSDWRDSIGIVIGVDDDCPPGFYMIDATVEQIPGIHTEHPWLSLSKTGPDTVSLNEKFYYTIKVENSSDAGEATNVVVKDTIPAGLTYYSSSPTASVSGNTATWNIGTLDAGNSEILKLRLNASQVGQWTNKAIVTSAEDVEVEASATTQVINPLVSIDKTGPSQGNQGTNIVYTITVNNTGSVNLTNTTVTDQIPTGMSYISSSPTGSHSGQQVWWSLGTMTPGEQEQLSLTVSCDSVGSWTNSASVSSSEGATDTDTSSTDITTSAGGMTISSTDTVDPISVGVQTTYVITVTNQGLATLHHLQIINTISNKMSFISASGPATYSVAGQVVTFTPVATVTPSQTLTYYITVRADTAGSAVNTSSMTYDEFGSPVTTQEGTTIHPTP